MEKNALKRKSINKMNNHAMNTRTTGKTDLRFVILLFYAVIQCFRFFVFRFFILWFCHVMLFTHH